MTIELIVPDWPAPDVVCACTTTRQGGVSRPPWDSLNLAAHVGDDAEAVQGNRERLAAQLGLPSAPLWLQQVHGTRVCIHGDPDGCADACFAAQPGQVCAVLTADCLPILLCAADGSAVAAAHAGWRGLLAGVIEQTAAAFAANNATLLAWLGPAIGPQAFEVGDEVREAFVDEDSAAAGCFAVSGNGRWLADLYALARLRLARLGIDRVYGGTLCTYRDRERFFSYRRDGDSGRMASLIWLQR